MIFHSYKQTEQLVTSRLSNRKLLSVKRNVEYTRSTLVFIFFSLFLLTTDVFAAAGDLITNTATIQYVVDGSPGVSNATASFAEDRLINFIVSESNGGAAVPVVSNMTDAVMQFVITNTGNAVHDYLLTAVNTTANPFTLPADNFDPMTGTIQVFVESGIAPGYQAAQDTAVYIDELNVNASQLVYVVSDMPALATDDVAAIALIAQVAEGGATGVEGQAVTADANGRTSPAGSYSNGATSVAAGVPLINADTLAMETVFNDPAGNSPEDISSNLNQDIAGNGQHVDAGAYQSSSPVLINKSVTVIDTLGGSDPHPGATLRYQLDITITGNTAVSDLLISDVIPANTTYSDGSIVLNGTAQSDANDTPTDFSHAVDILSKPVTRVEVDLSQGGAVSLAPGSTSTIIFEVTID